MLAASGPAQQRSNATILQVMSGLKRVEDQKYEMKKLSSTNNLEPCQTDGKEGGKEDVGSKNADGNGNESIKRESDSTDKKVRFYFLGWIECIMGPVPGTADSSSINCISYYSCMSRLVFFYKNKFNLQFEKRSHLIFT